MTAVEYVFIYCHELELYWPKILIILAFHLTIADTEYRISSLASGSLFSGKAYKFNTQFYIY